MKISGLTSADYARLIAATAAAKQRMQNVDRDTWPPSELDHGPVDISVVIAELLKNLGPPAQQRSIARG